MNKDNCIIISGSSVTNDSAWPTWATWTRDLYGLTNTIDLSVKGLGNKTIILRALKAAAECGDPQLIIVQLTSVDKWDWYVEDAEKIDRLAREKHSITFLDTADKNGFWSTGSHFPLDKEHYRQHYFGIQYHMFETLMMLQWFQFICQKNHWSYHVIFDSPILAVTEGQLNTGRLSRHECHSQILAENSLSRLVNIDLGNVYLPGLIGYACLNDLSWHHPLYKAHPSSYAHFCFTKDILAPVLDAHFGRTCDIQKLEIAARKFQRLVN
jgi:hypothetical protein